MVTLSFGQRKLNFDDTIQYCCLMMKIIDEETAKVEERYDISISKTQSVQDLAENYIYIAKSAMDPSIQAIVDNLIDPLKIYNYDAAAIKSKMADYYDLRDSYSYRKLLSDLQDVNNAEEQQKMYREMQKASRGRWVGGGFGISGAIKGAVKAGAMNAVGDAFHGIGDAFAASSDSSKFNNMRESITKDSDRMEALKSNVVYSFYSGIIYVVGDILRHEKNVDSAYMTDYKKDQAQSLFNNLNKIPEMNERNKVFADILSLKPFDDQYLGYLLKNYSYIGLSYKEAADLYKFFRPVEYYHNMYIYCLEEINNILTNNESYERKSIQMKDLALKYEYIDEKYNKYSVQGSPDGFASELVLVMIYYEMLSKCPSSKDEVSKIDDLSVLDKYLTECNRIFTKYRLREEDEQYDSTIYGIAFDPNQELKFSPQFYFRKKDSPYYGKIADYYLNLKATRDKLYNKLYTEYGITSTDAKSINKQIEEVKKAEVLEENIDPYCYFDSQKMEVFCQQLEAIGSKSAKVSDKVKKYRQWQKDLIDFENTNAYDAVSDLKKVAQSISVKSGEGYVYAYNDEKFNDELNKLISSNVIEPEPGVIPIAIYDANALNNKGFWGWILYNDKIYSYGTIIKKSIEFSDIIGLETNKKDLFINTQNNGRVKTANHSSDLHDFVKKFNDFLSSKQGKAINETKYSYATDSDDDFSDQLDRYSRELLAEEGATDSESEENAGNVVTQAKNLSSSTLEESVSTTAEETVELKSQPVVTSEETVKSIVKEKATTTNQSAAVSDNIVKTTAKGVDEIKNQPAVTSEKIVDAEISEHPKEIAKKKKYILLAILILICGFFGIVYIPFTIAAFVLLGIRIYKLGFKTVGNILLLIYTILSILILIFA